MLLAVPIGIGVAAYLSDVAHWRVREIVKPVVEILAGIPSVVVGFLGIVLVRAGDRQDLPYGQRPERR